ncbi:TetR/AcrR family transcriptional regulator [Kurthia senegalensis]|uniref:TetR/AcrR family transcriptional regulator n=1 Tax=Kurthia senegalensis TaxID=1033740 RepID=UPI00028841AB|nr:TetR/AcrR family transcriptional regulator [Kurthia senegalensis]
MSVRKIEQVSASVLLEESLKNLLKTKTLDDISIQEITDGANLKRASFYFYYKNKQALYAQLQRNYFYTIETILQKVTELQFIHRQINDYIERPFPPLVQMFNFMKKEKQLTNDFLGIKSSRAVTQQLEGILEKDYISFYKKNQSPNLFQIPTVNYDKYIVQAMIGVIFGWVDQGMQDDTEAMAILVARVTLRK